PVEHRMAIVAAIQVDWMETNQRHQVEIEVALDDPRKTVFKTKGQFEVGRPAGIPEGQSQRIQISLDAELTLSEPGQYVLVARAGGDEKQVPFRVQVGPMLAMKNHLENDQKQSGESDAA
ncbi:MAG: DUF6941 family protein, partial [Chloroflexota bacterium]